MYGIDYCYYSAPNEKKTNLYFMNVIVLHGYFVLFYYYTCLPHYIMSFHQLAISSPMKERHIAATWYSTKYWMWVIHRKPAASHWCSCSGTGKSSIFSIIDGLSFNNEEKSEGCPLFWQITEDDQPQLEVIYTYYIIKSGILQGVEWFLQMSPVLVMPSFSAIS